MRAEQSLLLAAATWRNRPSTDSTRRWRYRAISSCSVLFFFFSSRRRHTRFDCDWSSDVCSSDLSICQRAVPPITGLPADRGHVTDRVGSGAVTRDREQGGDGLLETLDLGHGEIGRASCRERV